MSPIQFDKDKIGEALTSLFPKEWVSSTASDTNFIKRHRKVDPVVFLWSLILGFGVDCNGPLGTASGTDYFS